MHPPAPSFNFALNKKEKKEKKIAQTHPSALDSPQLQGITPSLSIPEIYTSIYMSKLYINPYSRELTPSYPCVKPLSFDSRSPPTLKKSCVCQFVPELGGSSMGSLKNRLFLPPSLPSRRSAMVP